MNWSRPASIAGSKLGSKITFRCRRFTGTCPGRNSTLRGLPTRAFDSSLQRDQTRQLFADYNRDHDLTAELDARFAALAALRIHAAPLRYYLWLPAVRIADMWLRPRTELFPSDPRWWEFNDDRRWLALSLGLGLINLVYVAMAAAGLLRVRGIVGIGLFVLFLFLFLRSLFLGTLENPEPRYTLECYPVVIVLRVCAIPSSGVNLQNLEAPYVM